MSQTKMTSLQRVLTSLEHREPDRVPLFLLVTMHGAKELGLSIKEYFSKAENVVEGQLKLRAKYRHDCIYNFFYASLEVEAWGGEVIYCDDGPPNSGVPFIRNPEDIRKLELPKIDEMPCLGKVLKSARLLKERIGDDAPIIGVVMSPFSLPVMQMGFDRYIELMYERPGLFDHLMRINEEFCVQWANAQLKAGSTAICYFDPVSSTTISTKEMYLKTGFEVAKRTLARIKGPTATHMASGRCLPIIGDLAKTGTAIIGVSAQENLEELKAACRNTLSVMGNLDGMQMRHWSPEDAEEEVMKAISLAGCGGGFILSDNHGEIPWQVTDDVLMAISQAVRNWGQYPLDWLNEGKNSEIKSIFIKRDTLTHIKKDQSKLDRDLEIARKQASDYAMALDLLSKITYAGTEKEVVENILELFTVLFSPQKLYYISLRNEKPEQVYSLSALSVEDDAAIRKRMANLTQKYAWSESGKGFWVQIKHKGKHLGILEVDEICFPEYKEYYLNLALSIVDVCGLAIENAWKYQQIKISEHRFRKEKEKAEKALEKVKKLSGLLPICSHCKKIRDDKGYWNRIETYIQKHSEAEFSHSICKACVKKLYPELDIFDN